jgi:glycosyltransferase involved in cell wall biosynthesis
MKIAFLISSRAMAGMEMRAARVARLAAERGHEMHFGCPPDSQIDQLLRRYGITRFPLYLRGSLDLYSSLKLARYLRRERIDLVMPFSGKDYWMTLLAARMTGTAVLINRSTANPVNPLSIPVMKRADGIVAVSQGVREVLLRQGFSTEQVKVVYLGVNTSLFSPEACPPADELRAKHNLPRGKFLIGCFGRSGKGQRVLLEADSRLADHHGEIGYFFAGEHLPERLGPFVEERPSLHGRVTLSHLVPHEAVPEYLKALDLIVMLPKREPFSNAVLEAMAMARPVILSRTLGNIEAIEDGVSGCLVDHDDREAIAARVRTLVTDPGEATRMGEAAAARVRRLFTDEVMMNRMEELWAATKVSIAHPRSGGA